MKHLILERYKQTEPLCTQTVPWRTFEDLTKACDVLSLEGYELYLTTQETRPRMGGTMEDFEKSPRLYWMQYHFRKAEGNKP